MFNIHDDTCFLSKRKPDVKIYRFLFQALFWSNESFSLVSISNMILQASKHKIFSVWLFPDTSNNRHSVLTSHWFL